MTPLATELIAVGNEMLDHLRTLYQDGSTTAPAWFEQSNLYGVTIHVPPHGAITYAEHLSLENFLDQCVTWPAPVVMTCRAEFMLSCMEAAVAAGNDPFWTPWRERLAETAWVNEGAS